MVVFKGDKRIFDKIIPEENTSTGVARVITIYGITSYADIEDVPIQITSSALGVQHATINVNNLGAIRLKMLDQDGITLDVQDNWVVPNQVYTIVYKAGLFILITQNQKEEKNKTYIIETLNNLVSLTSASTVQEIEQAFNNDSSALINSLMEEVILRAQDAYNIIDINYSLSMNNNVLDGFIFEFIHKGYYYKQTYAINTSTGLITGVTVEESNLLLRDVNNTSY